MSLPSAASSDTMTPIENTLPPRDEQNRMKKPATKYARLAVNPTIVSQELVNTMFILHAPAGLVYNQAESWAQSPLSKVKYHNSEQFPVTTDNNGDTEADHADNCPNNDSNKDFCLSLSDDREIEPATENSQQDKYDSEIRDRNIEQGTFETDEYYSEKMSVENVALKEGDNNRCFFDDSSNIAGSANTPGFEVMKGNIVGSADTPAFEVMKGNIARSADTPGFEVMKSNIAGSANTPGFEVRKSNIAGSADTPGFEVKKSNIAGSANTPGFEVKKSNIAGSANTPGFEVKKSNIAGSANTPGFEVKKSNIAGSANTPGFEVKKSNIVGSANTPGFEVKKSNIAGSANTPGFEVKKSNIAGSANTPGFEVKKGSMKEDEYGHTGMFTVDTDFSHVQTSGRISQLSVTSFNSEQTFGSTLVIPHEASLTTTHKLRARRSPHVIECDRNVATRIVQRPSARSEGSHPFLLDIEDDEYNKQDKDEVNDHNSHGVNISNDQETSFLKILEECFPTYNPDSECKIPKHVPNHFELTNNNSDSQLPNTDIEIAPNNNPLRANIGRDHHAIQMYKNADIKTAPASFQSTTTIDTFVNNEENCESGSVKSKSLFTDCRDAGVALRGFDCVLKTGAASGINQRQVQQTNGIQLNIPSRAFKKHKSSSSKTEQIKNRPVRNKKDDVVSEMAAAELVQPFSQTISRDIRNNLKMFNDYTADRKLQLVGNWKRDKSRQNNSYSHTTMNEGKSFKNKHESVYSMIQTLQLATRHLSKCKKNPSVSRQDARATKVIDRLLIGPYCKKSRVLSAPVSCQNSNITKASNNKKLTASSNRKSRYVRVTTSSKTKAMNSGYSVDKYKRNKLVTGQQNFLKISEDDWPIVNGHAKRKIDQNIVSGKGKGKKSLIWVEEHKHKKPGEFISDAEVMSSQPKREGQTEAQVTIDGTRDVQTDARFTLDDTRDVQTEAQFALDGTRSVQTEAQFALDGTRDVQTEAQVTLDGTRDVQTEAQVTLDGTRDVQTEAQVTLDGTRDVQTEAPTLDSQERSARVLADAPSRNVRWINAAEFKKIKPESTVTLVKDVSAENAGRDIAASGSQNKAELFVNLIIQEREVKNEQDQMRNRTEAHKIAMPLNSLLNVKEKSNLSPVEFMEKKEGDVHEVDLPHRVGEEADASNILLASSIDLYAAVKRTALKKHKEQPSPAESSSTPSSHVTFLDQTSVPETNIKSTMKPGILTDPQLSFRQQTFTLSTNSTSVPIPAPLVKFERAGSKILEGDALKSLTENHGRAQGVTNPTLNDEASYLDGNVIWQHFLIKSPRQSLDSVSRKSVDYSLGNTILVIQHTISGGHKTASARKESSIHKAIPLLPLPLAVLCLVLNIVLPGSGTAVSGFLTLCCGQPRVSKKDDQILTTMCVNCMVGLAQLCTVTFLLIGWLWSITWGVQMVLLSVQHRKEVHEQRPPQQQIPALSSSETP